MKNLFKKLIVPVICVFLADAFSRSAEAASKNPDDVARLHKFVNAQVKKGAKLSKDVENDKCYKWDKSGNLKSIKWRRCKLTGNIKLPSFNKLKSVNIYINPKLKGIDAGRNPFLEEMNCAGGSIGCGKIVRFHINRLDVTGCRKLKKLDARYNKIKEIDLSKNKELEVLWFDSNKIEEIDLSENKKLATLLLSGNMLENIILKKNNNIISLDISKTLCKEIDVSKLKKLARFYCHDMDIEKLDVSKNSRLEYLDCRNIQSCNIIISTR